MAIKKKVESQFLNCLFGAFLDCPFEARNGFPESSQSHSAPVKPASSRARILNNYQKLA
jgi:hypothetical protein